MVELLPLTDDKDTDYVKSLLIEFEQKTGSIIAKNLIQEWPQAAARFIKVKNDRKIVIRY